RRCILPLVVRRTVPRPVRTTLSAGSSNARATRALTRDATSSSGVPAAALGEPAPLVAAAEHRVLQGREELLRQHGVGVRALQQALQAQHEPPAVREGPA